MHIQNIFFQSEDYNSFMQENTFTQGNIVRGMLRFSIPYLITCFLQTFYGMADLFIVGQFNGAASITAVSVGSQLMHMLTVVIAGFAMGSTVLIARSVGAGDRQGIAGAVSTTFAVFGALAAGLTALLLLFAFFAPNWLHKYAFLSKRPLFGGAFSLIWVKIDTKMNLFLKIVL